MAFERKLYVRKVVRTYEIFQVWESTAGKPQYIEKDGTLKFESVNSESINLVEDFHEPTDMERSLIHDRLNVNRTLGSYKYKPADNT